jgi:tRNA threonylcarbamoyladenosine modification (KEOPS) complex  Pcc1 subunit
MEYSATISVSGADPGKLEKLLSLESREGENDRASFTVSKEKDTVNIRVKADDSVALRATLVSITKILTIQERMQQFPSGRE